MDDGSEKSHSETKSFFALVQKKTLCGTLTNYTKIIMMIRYLHNDAVAHWRNIRKIKSRESNRSFISRFYAIFVEPEPNPNRVFQNRKERTGTEPNNVSTCEP